MKYRVVAADMQEALIRYRDSLHLPCDLIDICTILSKIHFDGGVTAVSSYKGRIPVCAPYDPSEEKAKSKADRRRQKHREKKWNEHCTEALAQTNLVRPEQIALIQNAEISQEQAMILTECLEALLQYQFLGETDGIIGLPCAEIAYLRSVQRSEKDKKSENTNAGSKASSSDQSYLMMPSDLNGFHNTRTLALQDRSGFPYYVFYGEADCQAPVCPKCGGKMTSKGRDPILLRHVPFGNTPTFILAERKRYRCNDRRCGCTLTPHLPFQDEEHRITKPLREYTEKLLSATFNLKDTSELTGVGINIVKEIDMARLKALYTEECENATGEGKALKLKKPEAIATYLSIDEFKLHNGHQYATIIIDLEKRHILWVQRGKKKQVVYDFFDHVGAAWMSHVKAVACDMNSDFQEAFEERYPHVRVVFDHFHIVKNFNEMVIAKIRIEEQQRLMEAGEVKAARSLKRSKYILMATRETLAQMDEEATQKKTYRKGSQLFNEEPVFRKGGKVKRYEALISENKLLLTCDLVKTLLQDAYIVTGDVIQDRLNMGRKISQMIRICRDTENPHFLRFANLLENHRKGVVAHATFPITSGVIEGVNQKIKTIRREGYGYPDDEYFFLKIMDASRNNYADQKRKLKLKPYINVTVEEIRGMVA